MVRQSVGFGIGCSVEIKPFNISRWTERAEVTKEIRTATDSVEIRGVDRTPS